MLKLTVAVIIACCTICRADKIKPFGDQAIVFPAFSGEGWRAHKNGLSFDGKNIIQPRGTSGQTPAPDRSKGRAINAEDTWIFSFTNGSEQDWVDFHLSLGGVGGCRTGRDAALGDLKIGLVD